jgi:hypothetical protein
MFAASKTDRAAAAAAATDPYFRYVPLLLETTSTNGQQNNTFLDSSTNNFTITRNGTPTQGSVTPYWPDGQWSNYFNGSSYITAPNNAVFAFGTGNFTVEAWVYVTNFAATRGIFDSRASGNEATGITFYVDTSGFLQVRNNGSIAIASTALIANTWNHCAVTRSGTSLTIWLNGASVAAVTNSTNFSQQNCYIGQAYASGFDLMLGYISNHRVVKGTAVYTGAFTPSTTPLTAISGTSVLTCQSNRFKDNSTNNFTITTSGTPQVQAFQPFSPTASYTAAAYGGSGYFDGGTNRLTTASNSAFNLSATDFTIEFWMYMTANPSGAFNRLIIIGPNGATSSFAFQFNTSGQIFAAVIGPGGASINGPTIPLNTWTHVALSVVFSSTTATLYINGVQSGQSTSWVLTSSATNTFYVGYDTTGTVDAKYTGYISNIRYVRGTAVYTGAFTPPTLAPLTTAGSTSAASYPSTTNVNTSFSAANTQLLTNFTNAGIYDAAALNNAITVGDAQASTTQYKWSPTSMKFDGTGDWLTAIDNPQLQLGTGDFTIDGWVYLSATGVAYGIISKGTASTGWSVNVTSGNKLQFSYTSSNLTGATSLAATTWYYFAVVRSGSATGNLKVYLNGTADATSGGAVTDNFNQTSILYTGADRVGTSPLNGYLQDVRVTKYARTITTPTAAFPTR